MYIEGMNDDVDVASYAAAVVSMFVIDEVSAISVRPTRSLCICTVISHVWPRPTQSRCPSFISRGNCKRSHLFGFELSDSRRTSHGTCCCVCARRNGSTWLEYEYSSGTPASGTNPRFCINSGWLSVLLGQ